MYWLTYSVSGTVFGDLMQTESGHQAADPEGETAGLAVSLSEPLADSKAKSQLPLSSFVKTTNVLFQPPLGLSGGGKSWAESCSGI